MRIVVLTSQAPNHVALCHKLAEVGDIAAIVVSQNVPRKPAPRPLRRFANRVEMHAVGLPLVNAWRSVQERYRARWPRFPDAPQVFVRNVNAPDVLAALDRYAPDLVVVSGTNMVGKTLIEKARARLGMLNLHTGLSPYVKGGPNCTNWCLAEGAFHLIGCTVMWIDPGIDSGALLLTEQTPLTGEESLSELHFGVMEHGHDAYVRAVRAVRDGSRVPRLAQRSIGAGRTYYVAEWTGREMVRAQLNFYRRYRPAYFGSAEHRALTASLRLVSLSDAAEAATGAADAPSGAR